ncbi:uncharacterized protein EI90DRAFT_3084967, partial [Cantharellus anzutake]|uniref:uncharacterized protein n=1 Tax=Cantharellus anzutake TaxID=1750568 RepID=UPI0019048940
MQTQASPLAIEHETPNLRTLRRLSASSGTNPDSLNSDPPISFVSTMQNWENSSTPVSDQTSVTSYDSESDTSHLFWVPAHLHPELAPAEFRAFLREHASAAPGSVDATTPLGRAMSRSRSLSRQTSMLSRQYKPRPDDGVENEDQTVINRSKSRSSVYAAPQLTMDDIQKLEILAEEAARSEDPSRLRSVLRRSLSMSQPNVIDQMDDIGTENIDEPIIVPPPGQILRRTARTKIRKTNLPGDGGGHRFASTRRGRAKAAAPDPFLALEDATSESEHRDSDPSLSPSPPAPPSSHASFAVVAETDDGEGMPWDRPLSYSEESAIYDSYADRRESNISRKSEDDDTSLPFGRFDRNEAPPIVIEPQAPSSSEFLLYSDPHVPDHALIPQQTPHQPPLHHPIPHQYQNPLQVPPNAPPARSPSPGSVSETHSEFSILSASPPTPSGKSRKEKEKKGGLFKWGGDKLDAKARKEKPKAGGKATSDRASEKDVNREKESGFFSFFGGRKKQDDSPSIGSGAGPATAAALLGASKSKTNLSSMDGQPFVNNYARYPIHVERAVYRLSHIKLANPRRPLCEQVLISNLMFWYLGIINKPTTPPASTASGQAVKEEKEKQERERLEREKAEKEREKEASRRKALNKANVNGGLGMPMGAGRKAEMPVKGPQYGIGMVMEQEADYGVQQAMRRGNALQMGYDAFQPENTHQPRINGPPSEQTYRQQPYYIEHRPGLGPYEPEASRSPPSIMNSPSPPRPSQPSLPPGAMPPVSSDHSWLSQSPYPSSSPIQPSAQTHRQPPIRSATDQFQYSQGSTHDPRPQPRQRSPSYTTPQPPQNSGPPSNKTPNRSASASAIISSGSMPQSHSPPPNTRLPSKPRESGPSPPMSVGGIRAVPTESDGRWGDTKEKKTCRWHFISSNKHSNISSSISKQCMRLLTRVV